MLLLDSTAAAAFGATGSVDEVVPPTVVDVVVGPVVAVVVGPVVEVAGAVVVVVDVVGAVAVVVDVVGAVVVVVDVEVVVEDVVVVGDVVVVVDVEVVVVGGPGRRLITCSATASISAVDSTPEKAGIEPAPLVIWSTTSPSGNTLSTREGPIRP